MSEKSERDAKIRQSYLDNIKNQTGKGVEDFRALAAKKKLEKFGDVVAWLKAEHGLGHGHANLMAHMLVKGDPIKAKDDDALIKHFGGEKLHWRKAYDALAAQLAKFGDDVELAPNNSYINVVRGTKKFGIVQISAADRMDIGIKRKGAPAGGRFEQAGKWNAMVTHRVRITDARQIDAELLMWMKQAYDAV